MRLIDVHAHLVAPEFAHDIDDVLARAAAAGVEAVISVIEAPEEIEANLALAARHPMVKPSLGLFPTCLDWDAAHRVLEALHRNADRVVAVGEVGLDYWKVQDPDQRALQRKILAAFVAAANALELPLNVHSRSAGQATIEFLRACGARRVLMHAFDARAQAAILGVEAGFFFSIPPSAVRSPQKQKLIRRLPLSSLMLETDSPVLGPDAAERNEPANVRMSCQVIAELQGVPMEAVAQATTATARRLFARGFDL